MAKDGGPAFGKFIKCGEVAISEGGLTVRDWFAGQALIQALAMEIVKRRSMISPPPFDTDGVATACYDVADALLKEREK